MVDFIADRVIPFFAAALIALFTAMVACVCTAIWGGWDWVVALERYMDWIVFLGFYSASGLLLSCLSLFAWMLAEDHFRKVICRSEPYRLMEQEKEMWHNAYRDAVKMYAKACNQLDDLRKKEAQVEVVAAPVNDYW